MPKETVELKIPAKKKYLSMARLTLSGMALGEKISIDDLEDIQLLVSESCNMSFKMGQKEKISIVMSLEGRKCSFSVDGIDESMIKDQDEIYMSSMIIDSLADGVEYRQGAIFVTKDLVD